MKPFESDEQTLTAENAEPVCPLVEIILVENETNYGFAISIHEMVYSMNDTGKAALLAALGDIAAYVVSGRKKGETVQ